MSHWSGKKAEVKVSCQADFAKARATALSAAETVVRFLQPGDCLAVQGPLQAAVRSPNTALILLQLFRASQSQRKAQLWLVHFETCWRNFVVFSIFFSVHGTEMCAESLWFETGSLQSSDNDT